MSAAIGRTVDRLMGALEAKAQRRQLPPWVDDASVIDLTHNDYLGLARDHALRSRAHAACADLPTGARASRLLGGSHPVTIALEQEFAAFKGHACAHVFPTGYTANFAVMTALSYLPDTAFFSDARNHASLIDGIRLSRIERSHRHIFPHRDYEALSDQLKRSKAAHKFVITESLFSMDGDTSDLSTLSQVAADHGAFLVVDEAHAIGVLGPKGKGLANSGSIASSDCITLTPCGKAMGAQGGFAAGPDWLGDLLQNHARSFIYSTAVSPWLAQILRTHLQALPAMDAQRATLSGLSRELRASLADAGIDTGASTSHIVPIVCGSNERAVKLSARLRKHGIKTLPVRPPTVPEGSARVRLSLHALLSPEDVSNILTGISKAWEEL